MINQSGQVEFEIALRPKIEELEKVWKSLQKSIKMSWDLRQKLFQILFLEGPSIQKKLVKMALLLSKLGVRFKAVVMDLCRGPVLEVENKLHAIKKSHIYIYYYNDSGQKTKHYNFCV